MGKCIILKTGKKKKKEEIYVHALNNNINHQHKFHEQIDHQHQDA